MGNRLRFGMREQVREFIQNGGLAIGICNGFQVLVKMGLLPGDDEISLTQTASLALNDSGHYEDRWVTLEFDTNSHCVWTKGIERIRVPVRHGEGKFVTTDPNLLDHWATNGQIVVKYVDPKDPYPSSSDELLKYPLSPNASMRNIAGVCDPTGRVFGLMPHPEANHSTWLGATWTRELKPTEHGEGEGLGEGLGEGDGEGLGDGVGETAAGEEVIVPPPPPPLVILVILPPVFTVDIVDVGTVVAVWIVE